MSKDIPLAISEAGVKSPGMFIEPSIQPVDWKKEIEMMRKFGEELRQDKRKSRAFLRKVGFDLKTGKLVRPGR